MRSYSQIFWGFILVFVNINIGIDILPDFIGYIIILIGLNSLEKHSSYFSKGKIFAFIFIFYSIPQFFGMGDQSMTSNVQPFDWQWLMYDQVGVILQLILVYYICKGIQEQATMSELTVLAEQAIFRWKLFFVVSASTLLLTPFVLNFDIVQPFIVILLIGYLIVMIIFLHLLRRAYREL